MFALPKSGIGGGKAVAFAAESRFRVTITNIRACTTIIIIIIIIMSHR